MFFKEEIVAFEKINSTLVDGTNVSLVREIPPPPAHTQVVVVEFNSPEVQLLRSKSFSEQAELSLRVSRLELEREGLRDEARRIRDSKIF